MQHHTKSECQWGKMIAVPSWSLLSMSCAQYKIIRLLVQDMSWLSSWLVSGACRSFYKQPKKHIWPRDCSCVLLLLPPTKLDWWKRFCSPAPPTDQEVCPCYLYKLLWLHWVMLIVSYLMQGTVDIVQRSRKRERTTNAELMHRSEAKIADIGSFSEHVPVGCLPLLSAHVSCQVKETVKAKLL